MSTVATNNTHLGSTLTPTRVNIPSEARDVALQTLENTPLPTTRVEAWKYTRVAKLGRINFQNSPAAISDISAYIIDKDAPSLVFINGHFSKELSSQDFPAGVTCTLLSEKGATGAGTLQLEGEIFNALNTAYLNDGIHIDIDAKAIVEQPIQVIHLLTGDHTLSNFKMIVNAQKSSQASIVQGFFSENSTGSFCNSTTEVSVAENAHLTIDKVQFEDESSYHISTEQVAQDKNSTFSINTFTLNGGLVRNNLNIDVNGQNCVSNLNGAYLLKGKQHVDNHSIVDHKVPNCESHELYKGVIDDKSTAVFNGKVFVRQDAQKINAFQSNGNVLLSDDATVNSKPELEIYADDVKCSHGSTTGQLDEEAVFYLRARGISEKSARQLMVAAFVGDVLEKVENENVLNYLHGLLNKRFGWEF